MKATRLLTRDLDGACHVTGVATDHGEFTADLVVDALGRRSPLPDWLDDVAHGAVEEEAEDSGFLYYTRYFRSKTSGLPQYQSAPLTPFGSFSILILPGDNDTWSVTLVASSGDQPLKRLRDPGCWASVIAVCPLHAHWLDGDATSDILAMGGIADRRRELNTDGRPAVHGVALLGDAWACTNPSLGRGMSLGLLHAQHLRDVVGSAVDDPRRVSSAWEEVTRDRLLPWYDDTVAQDRARMREMEQARVGSTVGAPEDPAAAFGAAVPIAARCDPDVFRGFLENRACHATWQEIFARPGFAEHVMKVAGENEVPPIPGPDREQLLALVG